MKIITLTLNPAYDIHCHISDFKPCRENLAEITETEAGGKGINISRALTACGIDNQALTVLCTENSDSFKRSLEASKIKFHEISMPGRIRENITIHTDNSDETRISFAGFTADNTLLEKFKQALYKIIDPQCIVTFTGRIPSGVCVNDAKDFIKELSLRGVKTVIDSNSFSLSDIIELKPWLIKPNEQEISEYLNENIDSFDKVHKASITLHNSGIENVMISLGSKGALLCCSDGVYTATPPKIQAISTIGAGDSTIAGFLASEINGDSSENKLRRAVAYGSAACMTSGTKPPRPDDITKIYDQINIKKLESF